MTHLTMMFLSLSQIYNLPPGLLKAVCFVESKHDVGAIHYNDGNANSVGICQLQLPTARVLGFKRSETDLRQVDSNISFAARYLHRQLWRYHRNIPKAIAAYNSGTVKLNSDGTFRNKTYVNKVLAAWKDHK